MNAITITEIGNAHSEAVVDLILPIQTIEFKVPLTLSDQPDLLTIDAFYRKDGGNFWGAFDGPALVGTIGLVRFHPGAAAIRKMFVRKAYRGRERGVATALLAQLTGYARAIGIKDIYLGTVHVLHAAHRFYERSGFQKIEKHQLPPGFPAMPAEDVYYHLSLPALGESRTKSTGCG
ncbi:MAG: GNAT family N-acetyltransferase [Cytophagales bacterium]|nr:GNAT family N-acetyltransferase [Cytophagales bacterium]